MTAIPLAADPPRNRLRSAGAVIAGILVNVILAFIADEILHRLGVFPPWGVVTYAAGPFALATAYRCVFGVLGAYVTARLAPRAPMWHALLLGWLGVFISSVGVVANIVKPLGPMWYAVALAVVALPLAWLGGWLAVRAESRRA